MPFARTFALFVALLALAGSSALAAPGDCRLIRGAETPDVVTDDVSACRQDVWLHQAQTKAGNAAAVGQGTYPSWNTTKPTASVQSGAGGGYANLAAVNQNAGRADGRSAATFQGTFTGPLDNLAATLYVFNPGRQAGPDQAVWMQLKVDNQVLYQSGAADRTPLVSAGNAVFKTDFAFENVYAKLQELGVAGDASTVHNVELMISGWFSANDNSIYVYDTSEVPAGLVFNAEPTLLSTFTKRIDLSSM